MAATGKELVILSQLKNIKLEIFNYTYKTSATELSKDMQLVKTCFLPEDYIPLAVNPMVDSSISLIVCSLVEVVCDASTVRCTVSLYNPSTVSRSFDALSFSCVRLKF